jgi:uncharacterized SAM-binding protein YcdF (DUF218 family)
MRIAWRRGASGPAARAVNSPPCAGLPSPFPMSHDAAVAIPAALAGGRGAPSRSPAVSWRRALLPAAALLAASPLLGFLWFLHAAGAPPVQPDRATDGIVVLTGGADRVGTGLRLLEEGRAGRLLVSGAHRGVTLADLAAVAGLPPGPLQGRVALGHAARSTRGNAAETAAWARAEGVRSIRLVTSGYHMPRALLELRRSLPPEVEILAHPVAPRETGAPGRMPGWGLLAGEYAKLVGAALGFSRPDPFPPEAAR